MLTTYKMCRGVKADKTKNSKFILSLHLILGPVRFSYNPKFSTCFFSRNSVFLSQQISRNSISACFFSEANETLVLILRGMGPKLYQICP